MAGMLDRFFSGSESALKDGSSVESFIIHPDVEAGQVFVNADGTIEAQVSNQAPSGRYNVVINENGETQAVLMSLEDLRQMLAEKKCELRQDQAEKSVISGHQEPKMIQGVPVDIESDLRGEGEQTAVFSDANPALATLSSGEAEETLQNKAKTKKGTARKNRRATLTQGQAGQAPTAEVPVEGGNILSANNNRATLLKAKTGARHAEGGATTPPAGTAREGASGAPATATGEVAEGASAPPAMPEDGESGLDKQEGSEQFGTVLAELRTEVATVIKDIKSPEDFARMRAQMIEKIAKESGREAKRYFFSLNTIRKRVGNRELLDSETALVTSLERELWQLAGDKFVEVLKYDLDRQHAIGIQQLNATTNETDVDALATQWATHPPVVNSWKDFSKDLTDKEMGKAEAESDHTLKVLKRSLEMRRARLHDKQELDDFLENPEGSALANRCWEILTSEWKYLLDDLKRHGIQLSDDAIRKEWNQIYLPVIRERIVAGLMKQSSVSVEQAQAILRAIENDLKQSEKSRMTKKP